jgi:hypothetical protein
MMFNRRRIFRILAILTFFTGLGGCVLEPIGGGHRSGEREHEDRDRRDRGGDHRHDFGVNQKGGFGFLGPDATPAGNAHSRSAVFLPDAGRSVHVPLWA